MKHKFTVIILAGEREGEPNLIAQIENVSSKAFVEIGGRPMIQSVISALNQSGNVNDIIVSINHPLPEEYQVKSVSCESSPTRSLLKILEHLETDRMLLITTADHALLSTEIIHKFVEQYDHKHHDCAVAMLPLDVLDSKYPAKRRTRLQFKDNTYKSCNLFLFKNKDSAKQLIKFWQKVESHRKKPLKMAQLIGFTFLLRYLSGRLTLKNALKYLGKKTKTSPQSIILNIPEAALDVDTVQDLEFIRSIAKSKS